MAVVNSMLSCMHFLFPSHKINKRNGELSDLGVFSQTEFLFKLENICCESFICFVKTIKDEYVRRLKGSNNYINSSHFLSAIVYSNISDTHKSEIIGGLRDFVLSHVNYSLLFHAQA